MELSLKEVLHLAETVGFRLNKENPEGDKAGRAKRRGESEKDRIRCRRTIECEYTADQAAMMSWIYKAEFWVGTKVR